MQSQNLRTQYLKHISIILEKFNIFKNSNHTVHINKYMGEEEAKEDCF